MNTKVFLKISTEINKEKTNDQMDLCVNNTEIHLKRLGKLFVHLLVGLLLCNDKG